jgi:hypothetical protein
VIPRNGFILRTSVVDMLREWSAIIFLTVHAGWPYYLAGRTIKQADSAVTCFVCCVNATFFVLILIVA